MRYFLSPILISILAILVLSSFYYFSHNTTVLLDSLSLVLLLAVLELSISFDNAIVNAKILKKMSSFWRTMFFWVGLPIAVFGVRFLFPFILVSITSHIDLHHVFILAVKDPTGYQNAVMKNASVLYSFGAGFLVMVCFNFFKEQQNPEHAQVPWLKLENTALFKLFFKTPGILFLIGLLFALILYFSRGPSESIAFYLGVLIQISLSALGLKLSGLKLSGFLLFIYLEVLDASFSLDGVLGAFAFTQDPLIMLTGLGIGAVFVRSLTLKLLHKNTLQNFIYLEHGAHYAMGILGFILFAEIFIHIPPALSAILSFSFLGKAFYDSKRYNKKSPKPGPFHH